MGIKGVRSRFDYNTIYFTTGLVHEAQLRSSIVARDDSNDLQSRDTNAINFPIHDYSHQGKNILRVSSKWTLDTDLKSK